MITVKVGVWYRGGIVLKVRMTRCVREKEKVLLIDYGIHWGAVRLLINYGIDRGTVGIFFDFGIVHEIIN